MRPSDDETFTPTLIPSPSPSDEYVGPFAPEYGYTAGAAVTCQSHPGRILTHLLKVYNLVAHESHRRPSTLLCCFEQSPNGQHVGRSPHCSKARCKSDHKLYLFRPNRHAMSSYLRSEWLVRTPTPSRCTRSPCYNSRGEHIKFFNIGS